MATRARDWMKRTCDGERTDDMAPSTLDLYLAHAFIGYPAIWAELESRGADVVEARHVWRWIYDMSTHRLQDNTLAKHVDLFGPPSEVRDRLNLWSLSLWPDHQWSLSYGEVDWAVTSIGLVRRAPRQPDGRSALRIGSDTFAEVRAVLGDAPNSDGWWPWDEWEYDDPDGSVLRCDFVHGLLVAISRQTRTSPDRPPSSS